MTAYLQRMPVDWQRALGLRPWWTRFRHRLGEPRFWVVQGLVLLATAVHGASELWENPGPHTEHFVAVVMYGLYALPIVYASLNFGREGAIPTAVWAGLLSAPNIVFWHHGLDRLADGLLHSVMIVLAVIIAGRVDREVIARHETERAAVARHRSDARYQSLFAAVGEPIFVFDEEGRIGEANAAAEGLLGAPAAVLRGRVLDDVLGGEAAGAVRAATAPAGCRDGEVRLVRPDGSEHWYELVCSRIPTNGDRTAIQTLLHDVTDRRQRQRGLEAYTRQIVAAQEDERQRIARELHDGPVQGLILLCRHLDELAAAPANSAAVRRVGLKEARHAAEAIADEVRRFSRDLRPSILDDLGLVPAVRWLVKDTEQRTGIRGRFFAPEDTQRLAREAELALFRIAQEALHNVERHAQASEVAVTLTVDISGGRLTVTDNGKGMASIDLSPGAALVGRLGLLGMQERARLCGGELAISTLPGQGTRIEATIPSTPAREAALAAGRERSDDLGHPTGAGR